MMKIKQSSRQQFVSLGVILSCRAGRPAKRICYWNRGIKKNMLKKAPHGYKTCHFTRPNQRLPQLERPFHVDPLTTALSFSISNEPLKFWSNGENVSQAFFRFRLLIQTALNEHFTVCDEDFNEGYIRFAMFKASVNTLTYALCRLHVFHAWIEMSIKSTWMVLCNCC